MKLTLTAIALAVVMLGLLVYVRGTRRAETSKPLPAESQLAEPVKEQVASAPPAVVDQAPVVPEPVVEEKQVAPAQKVPPKNKKPAQANKPAKEPLKDPDARVALSMVGADPDAEAYWFGAINDPALPAHERQDLIEDLNEDGLSDPKHPAPDDLPLILNRLQIIEMLAPSAMDQVNADAFQEAYKDLVNLANLAVGQGQPVN